MKIKELGLEELTVSEKVETKGGVAPIVVAGLVVAGLLASTTLAHAPGTNGTIYGGRGSKGFGMVP